jgi:hypothetical protein
MNLAELQKALDALKRATESLRVMESFLPATDPFAEAERDRLEEELIDLMKKIRKAEDDLK